MKNKTLKGFTILEALISLMLMSIIIVITYSLFNLIGKQLSIFNNEHTQVLEYNLFNSAMMSDINKANDFNIVDDKLILKNYDNTEVHYSINRHYILRQHTIKTDTFNLQVINYEFYNNDTYKPLNKTLQVKLNVLNDTINAHYFLNKDHSEIINTMYFNED
ncbi:MAG: prepilin-type N-terminal cleavage/methylation domain-containing protein [Algibacter sp.]